jgi:hypothetical protein
VNARQTTGAWKVFLHEMFTMPVKGFYNEKEGRIY